MASLADTPEGLPALNLKVLSPSTEVDGHVQLAQLSATTTVGSLKQKIQETIVSHPSVDRMRLIYRGRVMARDTDTLIDVFGEETIKQSPDQSIHLVLRELPHAHGAASPSPATPVPRSSTVPPNLLRPPSAPPQQPPAAAAQALPTNPFRPTGIPRPLSQPPLPPHFNPHTHGHGPHGLAPNLPFPRNPFMATGQPAHGIPLPPELNNLLNQQFVATAQNGQANDQRPPDQPTNGHHQVPGAGNSPNAFPPPMAGFPPVARSANGSPAPGSLAGGNTAQAGPQLPGQIPGQMPFTAPFNRTFVREHQGPNGERWTFTVNTSAVPIATPRPTQRMINQDLFPGQFVHRAPTPHQIFPNRAATMAAPPNGAPRNVSPEHALQQLTASLEQAQTTLQNIRLFLNARPPNGSNNAALGALPPAHRQAAIRQQMNNFGPALDQIQSRLNTLAADPEYSRHRDLLTLQMLNNNMQQELADVNRRLEGVLADMAQPSRGNPSAQPTSGTQQTPQPAQPHTAEQTPESRTQSTNSPEAPEVFLLSSPSGPYAVVIANGNTYNTTLTSGIPRSVPMGLPQYGLSSTQSLGQQVLQNHRQTQEHQRNQPAVAGGAAPPQGLRPQGRLAQGLPLPPQALNPHANINAGAIIAVNLAVWLPHIWLALRLLFFLYIFSPTGNGTWQRTALLGGLAGLVLLAQAGMFAPIAERGRQHFENVVLPDEDGAVVEGWRRTVRRWERAVILLLMSLWPGLGERVVRVREQRERERREAEERALREQEDRERAERESEERAREERERERDEQAGVGKSGEPENGAVPEPSQEDARSKGKGKERATEPDDASSFAGGQASASSSAETRAEPSGSSTAANPSFLPSETPRQRSTWSWDAIETAAASESGSGAADNGSRDAEVD